MLVKSDRHKKAGRSLVMIIDKVRDD